MSVARLSAHRRVSGMNVFSALPTNVSQLVAWFDADDASTFTLSGTAVSEWRDKSGNGFAVSQGTANNQPARTGTVRGRACIDFDGTNDTLFTDGTGLASAYNGQRPITLIVVGEMHNAAEYGISSTGAWVSWGSAASGTPFFYARSGAGAGNLQLQIKDDASATGGSITANSAGPAANVGSGNGDFFILSASVPAASNTTIRVHTVMTNTGDSIASPRSLQGSITTSAAARPTGTTTTNRFAIGSLVRNVFGDFYPARICEVIVYGKVLSDAERELVVRYLARKYDNASIPVI